MMGMAKGYSTVMDMVLPVTESVGRIARDISLAAILTLGITSGMSYAGDAGDTGNSGNTPGLEGVQERNQETLQKKVEKRWEASVKDDSWREKLSGLAKYGEYIGIKVKEDLEKQLSLPDEVKIGSRTIDIVDATEVADYKRKEDVDYSFKILQAEDRIVAPAGIQAGTNKEYGTAEEFKKITKNCLENMMWIFTLSEADKEKADGISVSHSQGFPQYNLFSAEGKGYSGIGTTFPKVTFYFKEKSGEGGQNIYKIANSRR